jgi:hypothetical protein
MKADRKRCAACSNMRSTPMGNNWPVFIIPDGFSSVWVCSSCFTKLFSQLALELQGQIRFSAW